MHHQGLDLPEICLVDLLTWFGLMYGDVMGPSIPQFNAMCLDSMRLSVRLELANSILLSRVQTRPSWHNPISHRCGVPLTTRQYLGNQGGEWGTKVESLNSEYYIVQPVIPTTQRGSALLGVSRFGTLLLLLGGRLASRSILLRRQSSLVV